MLQVPLMVDAKNMGLAVIATDANPDAPGATVADEFFPVDTYDMQGHHLLGRLLADHHTWNILGVATCGSDTAPSVAAAAKGADVRGISLDAAMLTHNKFQVRRTLHSAGLQHYQPLCTHIDKPSFDKWVVSAVFTQGEEIWARIQQAYQIPLPWVVKPLEERASRGVSIVTNYAEYKAALDKVSIYGSGFLVEEQLQGTEHSAEMIVGNSGEVLWWNVVDRFFDYTSGVPIELGHANPTILSATQQAGIYTMVYTAARALGVTWGPFKVDCMLTADGPKVLECTARLSGGFDSQWTCPATGRHPMRVLLQLACGLPIEPQPRIDQADGYAAAIAILPTQHGILQEIITPAGRDGEVAWAVTPGQRIGPLQHNAERCGYVFTHATTQQEAWEQGMQRAQECAGWMRIAASA